MLVFVLSSRRSRPRALPQDLSTRLFYVWFCTKHLCFCFGGQRMACGPSPHLTGHGLRPPAIVLLPSAKIYGRSALLMVGRPCILPFCHFWLADHCASAFTDILMPAALAGIHLAPPPYTCMEGFHSCLACFVSFARVKLYKGRASPPSSRVTKKDEGSSGSRVSIVYLFYLYFSLSFALSVCLSLVLH